MSDLTSIKTQIQALITLANAKTGMSDGDLTTCVNTLIAGYGIAARRNEIPLSIGTDGNVYNGTGFKDGLYITSGNETARNGSVITGFIPVGIGSSATATGEQLIELQNMNAPSTNGYVRVAFYESDFTYVGMRSATQFATAPVIPITTDDSNNITSMDLTYITYYYKKNNGRNPAYFRICAPSITASSAIYFA